MRTLEEWKKKYPEKFVSEETAFECIHRGNTIFVSSGCAEPQYLVQSLFRYLQSNPRAFFDAEVLSVRTLGVSPYATEKFKRNFRYNSFFISGATREAINQGRADYTPMFLSEVPNLFYGGGDRVDVALIQTSPPDRHGYMSLGVGVDIVKAAVDMASFVITQVNERMPRVHGNTFIRIEDVDFVIPYNEPILEYRHEADTEIAQRIGKYVSRLIVDGDTIQVGYGRIPDAILANLGEKKQLGVHTELLADGIVDLMKKGVIDNSRKNVNRGKTVATFCMGSRETYDFIDDNPSIEFKPADQTNNPFLIAQHDNMVAINSALEIDLTGQSTAESIGRIFHSSVGGQADFMRGAVRSRGGRSILTIQSTARKGTVSRIVPTLREGAGATLTRGDIHYVVTEYGIAYLHGKNVRQRAMALIAVAHPKFRSWLVEEAKKAGLIYADQAIMPGEKGRYPEELETYRTTKTGMDIFLRPVKITDEELMKDFIHGLSDQSLYRRLMSRRQDAPHEWLQQFVVIDYTQEMSIIAVADAQSAKEKIVGMGSYHVDADKQTAEIAFAVLDDYQKMGIGMELFSYLTFLAKREGLLGFTASVLADNEAMHRVFEKSGFKIEKRIISGIVEMKMTFNQ